MGDACILFPRAKMVLESKTSNEDDWIVIYSPWQWCAVRPNPELTTTQILSDFVIDTKKLWSHKNYNETIIVDTENQLIEYVFRQTKSEPFFDVLEVEP